jgi:hypothetical protein
MMDATPASPAAPPRSASGRKRFSSQEDALLHYYVEVIHLRSWQEIAKQLPERTARQCRDRYNNYLCPEHLSSEWSLNEDLTIMKAYETVGSNWAIITTLLPGRNCVQVKNRWYSHIAAHPKRQRTFRDDLERDKEPERKPIVETQKEESEIDPASCHSGGPIDLGKEIIMWPIDSGGYLSGDEWMV